MRDFWRKYKVHIRGWVVFFAFDIGVALLYGDLSPLHQYLIYYAINILLFYSSLTILIYWHKHKKNILAPVGLVLTVAFYLTLYLGAYKILWFIRDGKYPEIKREASARAIWRCGNIFMVSIISFVIYVYYELKRKNDLERIHELEESVRLKNELLEVQKALAHAQNSHHFIANTLAFFQNQVEKMDVITGTVMAMLGDIYGYSTQAPDQDGKLALAEELEQVSKIIDLHRIRANNELYLDYSADIIEDCLEARILPYQMLTFVENMFQHGILNDPAYPANVIISCGANTLKLQTFNYKRSKPLITGHGTGLEHLKVRMRYYYQQQDYQLYVTETDDTYQVNLSIKL